MAVDDEHVACTLRDGDAGSKRRALAKAITLLESTRADHRARADALLNALLPHIDCLQTLDSSELAERLQRKLTGLDRTLAVFVQVNVSGEPSKSGVEIAAAPGLLRRLAGFDRLTVRGFMTVGLNSPDRGAVRAGYRALAALRDEVAAERIPGAESATDLSMGMSGDFADAIAEGATMVRLGSAVFGARPQPAPSGVPGR